MALQSCANHSCDPSAATEGEASGSTAVIAVRDIGPGDEVTISYLDEEHGGEGHGGEGGQQSSSAMSYRKRQVCAAAV